MQAEIVMPSRTDRIGVTGLTIKSLKPAKLAKLRGFVEVDPVWPTPFGMRCHLIASGTP